MLARALLSTFFGILLLAFSAGCAKDSQGQASTQYAGLQLSTSLFNTIRQHGGIRFCYMARDYVSDLEGQAAYNLVKPLMEQAVHTWLAPVRREASWQGRNVSIASSISLSCADGPNVVKVSLFRANANFQNSCLRVLGGDYHLAAQGQCRSMVFNREMWLNMSQLDSRRLPQVVLHEMGHLFGLADTYREAGAPNDSARVFQPALTIMNYTRGTPTLTADDEAGIVAVWNSVRQGGRELQCGPGYRGYQRDQYGRIYCLREGTNTNPQTNPSQTGGLDPRAAASHFGCTEHNAMQGSWSGCLELLRWRALERQRGLNADLDAHDLIAGVQGCTNVAGQSQFATCTRKLLTCVSSQWTSDNFACFASRGGNACFQTCQ